MRRLTFVLAFAAIAFVPAIARADDAGALAETLYQQGRALMAKGSYAAACPKLEESQRLDPGDGTLLALGYCHEGEGKLAQAWSEYTILATKADARHDRAQKAKERRAAIEPRLGRVAIVVPEATLRSAEQIEILRDGTLIGRGAWGTVSPVDPGRHVIEARAPGKKPRRMEVDVRSGESSEVSVAPFEDAAPPARPVADHGCAARCGRYRRNGFGRLLRAPRDAALLPCKGAMRRERRLLARGAGHERRRAGPAQS